MRFLRCLALLLLSISAASYAMEQPEEELTPAKQREYLESYFSPESAIGRRFRALLQASENPFSLIPYEQNYLLYTLSDGLNRAPYSELPEGEGLNGALDNHEVKFQLSLMFPLWRGILGKNSALLASYTQVSYWQALNGELSAPFRETNYEPQLFLGWVTDWRVLGMKLRWIEVGFNHQSNGRSEPLSRSWNRLFANLLMEKDNWSLSLKPYIRLQESIEEDDNPTIESFLGNVRLELAHKAGPNVYTLRSRYSFEGKRGSVELGWSRAISPKIQFYMQAFTGYGESLIEYDHKQTRVGVGFMLNDLL